MGVRKYTAARAAANKRWDAEHIARISVAMPPDLKDTIRRRAGEDGMSVNAWILDCIREKI